MSKIYVIGHQSPDLDSVAAAISYAKFKNMSENTDVYTPAVAGAVNKETEFALEKFGLDRPEALESAAGQELVLVDHNEFGQAVKGIEQANIREILDHHKLDFKYPEPIAVLIRPWGSSCSIIYDLFVQNKMELDDKLAGLMLSAALVDTVITKSPTTTDIDRDIIKRLADRAGISDWQEFGMEIFKVRSSVADLSPAEIVKADFKDFELKAGKFGIGQVETADLAELEPREDELLETMNDMRGKLGYHSVVLFLTDIINEGSKFLVASGEPERVEAALDAKLENGRVYLPGVMSRKKQVAPKFTEEFDK